MEIKAGDIIKFSDKATPSAAMWCYKYDIAGLVIEEYLDGSNVWMIDTILKYPIWVPGEHLYVVTNIINSPPLDDMDS